jgi:biotin operon repressor
MTLSQTKRTILQQLSEETMTYKEIADMCNISMSTARGHITDLENNGYDITSTLNGRVKEMSADGGYEMENTQSDDVDSHTENRTETYIEETKSKRQKSKLLTEHMQSMERRLAGLLKQSEPAVADGGIEVRDSHEDVVIHRTDAHFGDEVTDEFGNTVFDTEIAERRERYITNKTMDLIERQNEAGINYDTAHLLLGGDHVTGENIYPKQQAEIRETLDEQIDTAFEIYWEQIQQLSRKFPQVQVVCQPGNHGSLGASVSDGANSDRLLYMMLDKALRTSDLENVTFIRNNSSEFTNFYVRGNKESYIQDDDGWRFHLRHGDSSLEHIGTSAGKKRWYNWLLKHDFDLGYRGHYHKFEIDTVHGGTRVVMTGSPKPPDDFEESIAEWSTASATIHGVSDDRPMTWMFPVEFDE